MTGLGRVRRRRPAPSSSSPPHSSRAARRSSPPSARRARAGQSSTLARPRRSGTAPPPAASTRSAGSARAAMAAPPAGLRTCSGSPAWTPRTTSAISLSSPQSPPPITLPARALATTRGGLCPRRTSRDRPPSPAPHTPSSWNRDRSRRAGRPRRTAGGSSPDLRSTCLRSRRRPPAQSPARRTASSTLTVPITFTRRSSPDRAASASPSAGPPDAARPRAAPARARSRTSSRVANVDRELAAICAPTPASSYSDGLVGGPARQAGDVRARAPAATATDHAPLKPVCPVSSTRSSRPEVGIDRHVRTGILQRNLLSPQLALVRSPPPPHPSRPTRAEILGIPLAISDYAEVLDWMEAMIATDAARVLTAAAVNLVMYAQEEPRTTLRRASARRSPSPTASPSCGRCTRSATPAPPASTAPT